MEKRWCIALIITIVVMPLISMEREGFVLIKEDDDFNLLIKEPNLPLMKTLYTFSKEHKEQSKDGNVIPQYSYVSSSAICLVDQALSVSPHKFKDYYNKLSEQNRLLLTKVSGQYNEDGAKVMLDVPEITKRLLDVYFKEDVSKYIKSFIQHEDEDYVRTFFQEQLIKSKFWISPKSFTSSCSLRLVGDKYLMIESFIREALRKDIYLGSFFLNGCHTVHPYDYPISLRVGGKMRQTYGVCFAIDNYEYRITDVQGKQCQLWGINHDSPKASFFKIIELKNDIKGCCFSNTQLPDEGALIYSGRDMVFLTIHNGLPHVESVPVSLKDGCRIVSACFDSDAKEWRVAVHMDNANRLVRYSMQGQWKTTGRSFSFKEYGLLEKIALCRTACEKYSIDIYGVSNFYSIKINKESLSDGKFSCQEYYKAYSFYDYSRMISPIVQKKGESIEIFSLDYPFFSKTADELHNGIHRVYSPNGELLMCNSLKKNNGEFFVETVIQDAVTRKQILSIDTLYNGFQGVGFTKDSTELMFFNERGLNSKVSLLNIEDQQALAAIEKKACSNFVMTSLVKLLCSECRENGYISLDKEDSTYKMLREWIESSNELKVLEKLLPIKSIKK